MKAIVQLHIVICMIGMLISCQPESSRSQVGSTEGDSQSPLGVEIPMVKVPEGELRGKKMTSFWIDKHPVTVSEFARFIEDTEYKTDAQQIGDGLVFNFKNGGWEIVKGAWWLFPEGPEGPKAKNDHPVTQVSWNDAVAYAKWAGKRLPNQYEWEHAARNGNNTQTTYPWGENLREQLAFKANYWQGAFPNYNLVEDSFLTTSPVGHFGESELGLEDIVGNVWEWVQDWSPVERSQTGPEKLARGGSFLCDLDVCHGFQIVGETSSTPTTSLFHTGFRCVRDL